MNEYSFMTVHIVDLNFVYNKEFSKVVLFVVERVLKSQKCVVSNKERVPIYLQVSHSDTLTVTPRHEVHQ